MNLRHVASTFIERRLHCKLNVLQSIPLSYSLAKVHLRCCYRKTQNQEWLYPITKPIKSYSALWETGPRNFRGSIWPLNLLHIYKHWWKTWSAITCCQLCTIIIYNCHQCQYICIYIYIFDLYFPIPCCDKLYMLFVSVYGLRHRLVCEGNTTELLCDDEDSMMRIHMVTYGRSSTTQCMPDEMVGFMMTSSNGNIFRVTGPLCGEFTGD